MCGAVHADLVCGFDARAAVKFGARLCQHQIACHEYAGAGIDVEHVARLAGGGNDARNKAVGCDRHVRAGDQFGVAGHDGARLEGDHAQPHREGKHAAGCGSRDGVLRLGGEHDARLVICRRFFALPAGDEPGIARNFHLGVAEGTGDRHGDEQAQHAVGGIDVHVHFGADVDGAARQDGAADVDFGSAELQRHGVEVDAGVFFKKILAGDEGLVERQPGGDTHGFACLNPAGDIDVEVALRIVETQFYAQTLVRAQVIVHHIQVELGNGLVRTLHGHDHVAARDVADCNGVEHVGGDHHVQLRGADLFDDQVAVVGHVAQVEHDVAHDRGGVKHEAGVGDVEIHQTTVLGFRTLDALVQVHIFGRDNVVGEVKRDVAGSDVADPDRALVLERVRHGIHILRRQLKTLFEIDAQIAGADDIGHGVHEADLRHGVDTVAAPIRIGGDACVGGNAVVELAVQMQAVKALARIYVDARLARRRKSCGGADGDGVVALIALEADVRLGQFHVHVQQTVQHVVVDCFGQILCQGALASAGHGQPVAAAAAVDGERSRVQIQCNGEVCGAVDVGAVRGRQRQFKVRAVQQLYVRHVVALAQQHIHRHGADGLKRADDALVDAVHHGLHEVKDRIRDVR